MQKPFVLILPLGLIGGCTKSSPTPNGLPQFDQIRSLAEAFVLRGDTDAIRKHTDFAGVPPDALQQVNAMFDDWHGVPSSLKLANTKVMTFAEYETLQQEDKKDLPEDMRIALLSSLRWNVKPEKVIMFTFGSTDPNDTTTRVRWSAGSYQTNGLWFFAASYAK